MIADDLRKGLVDAISKVPFAANEVGRTTLLAGIPGSGNFSRNPLNASGDIMILVLQLEENYGPFPSTLSTTVWSAPTAW